CDFARSCAVEMDRMNEAMEGIQESGAAVTDVIKLIEGIGFQTNLLALNAAVEAARAGEAGSGFAVVADEVRSLAMRSADAAKSSSGLIEQANDRARSGGEISTRTTGVLSDILGNSENINALLSEISRAVDEQNGSISEVAEFIESLNVVTQLNAQEAENLSTSALDTSKEVGHLRNLLARFELSGNRHAAA
ncbi:MAG: hypothetical protein KDB61_06120, partial [Planctomycetes bacterium]|nr:hypothetical protein [Planctomycetota bacterium]